jgi:protein-tyrosine phosphatase
MFVALSILVQQLRTEKRVDIFTATRKLRSQRHGMLQTFVSDEIKNYSETFFACHPEPAVLIINL